MDKTTRLSVINEYEKGGLKMIDLETMIKSLRLAWLKRIFSVNDGAWKDYIRHQLKRYGGLFLFPCNYNVKDHPIPSQFYAEMLQWWAEFRDEFSTEKDWQGIIWNNKDVRINNVPVFYKTIFESGIICVNEFDLTGDELQKAYILSHSVCCEPYIRAFQYKVLNSILYTNTKLYKIGFATDDNCSFCKSNPETLSHFFFDCLYSHTFWKEFESYFHSISEEPVSLTLKDVIIGFVDSKRPLLNYLLLIAKLYLWDCRRTSMLPEIIGLKHKIKNKFEIEKYVNIKNNTLDKFKCKWTINCNLLLNI